MFNIQECSLQKSRGLSHFRGLRPSLYFFLKFAESAQMKMFRKIIYCKSLKNSEKNLYDADFFCNVASQQCSDCSFAIKGTHNRFFLKYVSKTSCLKKDKKRKCLFWEKSLWWKSISVLSKKQNSCKTFLYKRWKY